jgi:hypothetical protein
MKEKPRTENGSRFAEEFTDDDFIKALCECLETSTCSASEVAARIGCNPRYAKNRLLQLAENGKIEKKMKGTAWGFRLGKYQ